MSTRGVETSLEWPGDGVLDMAGRLYRKVTGRLADKVSIEEWIWRTLWESVRRWRGANRQDDCGQIFGREVLGAFMYMHMFAFRWKPGVTEEQKRRVVAEIRALQGQIPGLLETAVGMNISPRGGGYELGGAMKFADKAALDGYGGHPVHQ